ncbi:hypothetical protein CNY89_12750 [Amaricoccus sp. HAR-UPW-R2A-40]|nr:hypothetical protein CNY89_12750 [Amaricoccus sp. HAR-UPW-R2A-40]
MHDGRDEDELSRCLCRFVTGQDRMFSAVCWERRWTSPRWFALRIIVDGHFYRLRGERGHCRAAWRREMGEAGELPDRLRAAGL